MENLTPQAPGNCIPPMPPVTNFSETMQEEAKKLDAILKERRELAGISENAPKPTRYEQAAQNLLKPKRPDPKPLTPEEIEERDKQRQAAMERQILLMKNQLWDSIISTVGSRYQNCRFENYDCKHAGQQNTVDALQGYGENFDEKYRDGQGVFLYGSCGGGKDHLLIALAHQVIGKRREDMLENRRYCGEFGRLVTEYGDKPRFTLAWINGMDFYGSLRDGMGNDNFSEERFLENYISPKILILSDPLPPKGALSDYQAAMLFRIVDGRYRFCLPTWTTMNIATPSEAAERLTPQIVDRLRHGSLCANCSWPSYRKASQNVITK